MSIEYTNIASAIVATTKEIKGVEKNANVGTGNATYRGVNDKDVKEIVRKAMANNGLSILPIAVDETCEVDRWDAKDYKGNPTRKQQVFTRAKVTYRLLHTSGEYIDIQGIGHGVDSQDKSAGKATTYALKYALLYTFLVPTGAIDDSDMTHSNDIETAPKENPATTDQHTFTMLRQAKNLEDLKRRWDTVPASQKRDAEVIAVKDEMKDKLSNTEDVIEA